MNFDDIFGDEIFEKDNLKIDLYIDDLKEIFDKNGFSDQLTMLTLKCCDLMALNTIYRQLNDSKDIEDCKGKIINTMGVINTIIESFIVSDDEIFDSIDKAKDKYVNSELGIKTPKDKHSKVSNNRIAYLFENTKGE